MYHPEKSNEDIGWENIEIGARTGNPINEVTLQDMSTATLECFKNAPYEFGLVITYITMLGLTGDKKRLRGKFDD